MKKILVSLISLFAIVAFKNEVKKEKTTSDAPKAFPLSNLDTTVSPCEDFYQYAIGGWLKENPVPSTESRWSSFNVVRDSNNAKLKNILQEFSKGKYKDGSKEQKIGDFYKSVMDSSKAEELGIAPLQEEFERINKIQQSKDLIEVVAHHKTIGVNSLFGVYVSQDKKNSEQYISHISQSGLGLPDRDYYLKSDEASKAIQEAYVEHMKKIFALANIDVKAKSIYNIEHQLAKNSMSRVDRRKPEKTYNKFKFDQLNQLGNAVDWDKYFKLIGVKSIDEVIVGQPNFIQSMNQLIDSIPLDEWKNYLRWRLLDSYASELSSDFVEQNFEFYGKTLSGTKEMKPRWKIALRKINGNIGELLGKAFVERHFSEKAKADVSQMVENLRAVFRERINGLTWMSQETKEKALEKLNAFNKKIGFPDKWKDYSDLKIVADNQVQNIMNAKQFNFNYMIDKLGQPVDQDEWFMSPQTVNAYYSSSKNEIVFPAGILQPPFYSPDADAAINYGGIGAVIGHEFTHGFDDQGSKYDAKGNLNNWWTDEDRTQFDNRASSIKEQFNNYEVSDSLFINGELTLGENIADLGGATLAFHALEKELEDKENVSKIDGFSYQQRFFLGWAQVWHMNMTDEELKKRITTDPHSPGEYRVKGPLANMPEFAKAFNCDDSSPMVNQDSTKAKIW